MTSLSPTIEEITSGGRVSPEDVAELVGAFTQVTERLQATHEALHSEVARLEGELREARQQLGRARELAALGEMAAGIAHEVRNPLGSIRLYAGMLADDLADRPEQRQMAERVRASVTHLDAVVTDVLTFARDLRIKPARVCAERLIDRAVRSCEELSRRHQISISIEEVAPIELECDEHLVVQALVNIVRNACEAVGELHSRSPGTGHVRISAQRAGRLDPSGRSREVLAIAVTDNGPGIPPEVEQRMFNPFFTTRDSGTGLGLAIVHRIVDAHSGRISIQSRTEPGAQGASVEIALPLTQPGDEHEGDSG